VESLSLPRAEIKAAVARMVLPITVLGSNSVVFNPATRIGNFCLLPSRSSNDDDDDEEEDDAESSSCFICVENIAVPAGMFDERPGAKESNEYHFDADLWETIQKTADAADEAESDEGYAFQVPENEVSSVVLQWLNGLSVQGEADPASVGATDAIDVKDRLLLTRMERSQVDFLFQSMTEKLEAKIEERSKALAEANATEE
jgi:hypothetical protein